MTHTPGPWDDALAPMINWLVTGWPPSDWEDDRPVKAPVTIGDLRRAAAALAKARGE